MNELKFKPHKIPGVDLDVCCCEQKIAYNYLFAWLGTKASHKLQILSYMQSDLNRRKNTDMKRYDIDLVYHYILQSFDRYRNAKQHIFTSYAELGTIIYSDYFKP